MSQRRGVPRGEDFYMDVWHREDSLLRFVGKPRAGWMSQIDIDSCEWCHLGGCSQPVALVETKLIMSRSKTTTVTANLATMAGIPAFLVEYETSTPLLRCVTCDRPDVDSGNDITYFVVTPLSGRVRKSAELQPAEYAEWLWSLRFSHWRDGCANPASSHMLAYPVGTGRFAA